MISIFLSILDHFLKFHEQLTKILDLKLFSFSILVILLYGLFLNFNFVVLSITNLFFPTNTQSIEYLFKWPFGGYVQLLFIIFLVSVFVNRKLIFFSLNNHNFFSFYRDLNKQIATESEFIYYWEKYTQICQLLDREYWYLDEESHLNGIVLIYRRIHQKFSLLSLLNKRNIKTANTQEDLDYQDRVMILSFIQKICDYVIQYHPERHLKVKEDSIDNALKEIQLEDDFIEIISYCHIDGKGFLTTLALQNLIAISLLLPQIKRIKILKLLKSMPIQNIGWLNRRLFEAILINVAMDSMSKNEWELLIMELKNLNKEILSFEPKLVFDERIEKIKGNFKNQILSKYILGGGFEYAP